MGRGVACATSDPLQHSDRWENIPILYAHFRMSSIVSLLDCSKMDDGFTLTNRV